MSQSEINRAYETLIDLLLRLDPSVSLSLGNSVWTASGLAVRADFLERVRASFGAEAATVNFSDPATLARINRWVNDATRGRIEKIFDDLPANVVMVLLNAIYFKGNWTNQFDRARTDRATFTRPDGSRVVADMMYLDRDVFTRYGDGVTLVELPYGGEAFSMVIALPDVGVSVDGLVRGLTMERWQTWVGGMGMGRAIVRLPRFEMEWEKRLNEPLQRLGMTHAFAPGSADFRRLTAGGGMWLDLVKQKSFVRVDEVGTEAAAVTVGVGVTSFPQEIRFDRPFAFVLRERLSGAILFMGVVNDPTR
jgi:serpin B